MIYQLILEERFDIGYKKIIPEYVISIGLFPIDLIIGNIYSWNTLAYGPIHATIFFHLQKNHNKDHIASLTIELPGLSFIVL